MPRRTVIKDSPVVATRDSGHDASLSLVRLKRPTVVSMTADALRDRILRGDYAEGVPLRQDAIAQDLGVSRIPVREALRQLEAEGLVTFSPHRGAIVSCLSLKEIRELFEIRAEIESDLLRRAIPEMGSEDFARASEILTAYDGALRSGEVAVWGALNWQFHSTLYAPADRALSMGIVSKLHQHSDRYLRLQLALTHGESRARQEHRAILAAVKKRDTTKACQLLRDHVLGAGKSLVSFLETTRGKPQNPILYPIPRNRISR